jgi:hypothetical protein
VPRLFSFFVALLLVLVGLGSALANGSGATSDNARKGDTMLGDLHGAAVQQADDVPDPDHATGSSATPSDCDDDDNDCDEAGGTPSRLSFTAPFPSSISDPLCSCDIRPSQGHGTGPEKPPRG